LLWLLLIFSIISFFWLLFSSILIIIFLSFIMDAVFSLVSLLVAVVVVDVDVE